MCLRTGSSHDIFPSSISIAIAAVVNALVSEPIANTVCEVTGSDCPRTLTP